MKTTLSLLTISLFFFSLSLSAADLIVEEFAVPPTAYPSIQAAIDAAVDGDRILIKNRFGNIPWTENLTIAKSLTLINGIADTTFLMVGDIDITSAPGREVTIISAQMLGSTDRITATGGSAAERGCIVNVFSSYFDRIDCDSRIISSVVGNVCRAINIDFGDVIGNKMILSNSSIIVANNKTASSTFLNDTCYIIGNYINANVSSGAIYYEGGAEVVYVKNNYASNTSISSSNYGINVKINEASHYHEIFNNYASGYNRSVYAQLIGTTSSLTLMNNDLATVTSSNAYSIYASGARIYSYFNRYNGRIATGLTTDVNNAATTIIDMGNPAPIFTDIDLTRNDIGINGGSYPFSNFMDSNNNPLAGSARVFLVTHPFYIRQGNTIKVNAIGYDR